MWVGSGAKRGRLRDRPAGRETVVDRKWIRHERSGDTARFAGGAVMVGIGHATRIYLAVGGTDMRKSFDGLSGLVREKLREDPLSGHLFLFCNKPRNRLKVMYWDGHG